MMLRTELHLFLLILALAFSYGFPKNKSNLNSDQNVTSKNEESEKASANLTELIAALPETEQEILKRPRFIKNILNTSDNTKDLIIYQENHDDGILKCLCWAEIFTIIENNENKERNVSNEFAIILESPGHIGQENLPEEERETFILYDIETKKNRTLTFVIVNKTEEYTVREHKILHCGAGPVLIKTYIEWPKVKKHKIEIRLKPATQETKWHIFKENNLVNPIVQKFTLSPNSQTFDTTRTELYSETISEDVTVGISKADLFDEVFNSKITLKNNKTKNDKKGSDTNLDLMKQHDSNETYENLIGMKVNEKPILISNTDIFSAHLSRAMKRELLMRNLYFKKLNSDESILNITENNFLVNPQLDNALFFFDLIYPNISTSFYEPEGSHKFIINFRIRIEHIAIGNINRAEQETLESITEMEEESVYHLK